jgi:hypothetical protein
VTVAAPQNPLPRAFGPGAWVFAARRVSYLVDTTTFGPADPVLALDPDGVDGPLPLQPLAEGVEDFQVALGFDLDGDGQLASVGAVAGDDEWIYNVAGEVAPPSLGALRAVRVTLVVRTTSPLAGLLGVRPAAEDHPGATTADAYPRRVLRSEIAVRNLLP